MSKRKKSQLYVALLLFLCVIVIDQAIKVAVETTDKLG